MISTLQKTFQKVVINTVQLGSNENLDKVIAFNYNGVETYVSMNYNEVETLIETES